MKNKYNFLIEIYTYVLFLLNKKQKNNCNVVANIYILLNKGMRESKE